MMIIDNSNTMNDRSQQFSTNITAENDPNRPPQLNPDNMSCHCACDCIRGTTETNIAPLGATAHDGDDEDMTSVTSSDFEGQNVAGDEGIEDHLIEVGDLGYVPIKTIYQALARHDRCTCHHGIGVFPNADDFPFTALPSRAETPGLALAGSVIVEVSSEEQSLASSLLSLQSCHSSVFALAGAWASHDSLAPPVGVYIMKPLRLTPELAYPLELSMSEDDFN